MHTNLVEVSTEICLKKHDRLRSFILQRLTDDNPDQRIEFGKKLLAMVEKDDDIFDEII